MIRTVARKNYSEEFRRQAVDLYESTPGATLRGIAADLGIERPTVARWVLVYGSGKKTGVDGTTTTISSSPSRARQHAPRADAEPETPEARIARLEAENAELRGGAGQAHDRAGDSAPGGQVFRRGDELVNRFQFVADHSTTSDAGPRPGWSVKRLCALVEIERSWY